MKYRIRVPMAFIRVAVVIVVAALIAIPGVLSCNSGSSPVVRMCYNNNITFTSDGFATSEGLPVTSRDCSCTLATDGSSATLGVVFTSQPGCFGSLIQFRPSGSAFGTKFDCEKTSIRRTVKINSLGWLLQYKRRTDDRICMQFSITAGGGSVQISCSGDDLSSAATKTSVQPTTTTTATQSTSTTAPVTSSPSSSIKTTPSVQTKSTENNVGGVTSQSLSTTITTLATKHPTTWPSDRTSSKTSTSSSVQTKSTGNDVGLVTSQSVTLETSELITINETVSNDTTVDVIGGDHSSSEMVTLATDGVSTPGNKAENSPRNMDGLIAGVVVGSIAFVILVILLVVFLERRRRAKKNAHKLMERDASMDNPAYGDVAFAVNDGYTISADVNEMTTRTIVDGKMNDEAGKIKGVTENGKSGEDISALYATVDKSKNIDTLY